MAGLVSGLVFGVGIGFLVATRAGFGDNRNPVFEVRFGLTVAAGFRHERGPVAFSVHRPTRPQLKRSAIEGLAIGIGIGAIAGLIAGFRVGIAVGISTGMMTGFTEALIHLIDNSATPLPAAKAVSPLDLHRQDFRRTIICGLVSGVGCWTLVGLVVGFVGGPVIGLVFGFVAGLLFGHAFGLGEVISARRGV
ncbi:hypothetical protein [Actinoplanes rectilineatus]|uniref:hypothetical protein n=1 Tax=Actinoplanes rectilineatus TaxID=113571 RepID=UPI0012F8536F|nr:hypothetical protein [Actinoplanes rectilineatus]